MDSLPLFDSSGDPRSDDVTGCVVLYDAGTEVNEAPGFGPNQAPRQSSPNAGVTEGGVIHSVTDSGFTSLDQVIHIMITALN